MVDKNIFQKSQLSFSESKDAFGRCIIEVQKEDLFNICMILKNNVKLKYNILLSVCAVDNYNSFGLIYTLYSSFFKKELIVKTVIEKDCPQLESIESLYKSADWNERECYDLMGIEFLNHPRLERLLMPKGWKGYPLRKDYKMDDERLAWNNR